MAGSHWVARKDAENGLQGVASQKEPAASDASPESFFGVAPARNDTDLATRTLRGAMPSRDLEADQVEHSAAKGKKVASANATHKDLERDPMRDAKEIAHAASVDRD